MAKLPKEEAARLRAFLEGMEFCRRICRNQAADLQERATVQGGVDENGWPTDRVLAAAWQGVLNCESAIRFMEVEIGAGSFPYPQLTRDEQEAIDGIWK